MSSATVVGCGDKTAGDAESAASASGAEGEPSGGTSSGADRSPAQRAWLTSPWLVMVVAVVAFLPSLWSGYVFDDVLLVRDNIYVHGFAHLERAFVTHFWDAYTFDTWHAVVFYRPLVTVSLMVDWVVGNGQPWSFHLTNLALHALCCWLACRLAQRWIGDARLGLVAGLLFAVHPTRVASVVWVAGRSDVFMAAFVMGTVECVHQAARARRALGWWLVGATLFGLGLLSKEVAVLTALLLAADAVGTAEPGRRRAWLATAVTGALGLAYVVGRALFYPLRPGRPVTLELARGLTTTAAYLERVLWPWPPTFFHRPLIEQQGHFVHPTHLLVLGVVIIVAYSALLVVAYRRDRRALFLLLSAVAFIASLLHFYKTDISLTTSDHYLYVPLWLLACGLLRLGRRWLAPMARLRAAALGLGGLALVMSATVVIATLPYRDNDTYWQHELSLNSHNPVALEALTASAAKRGETEEAYRLLQRIFTPESIQQTELFSAIAMDSYPRLLELRAALTPDGDVRTLRQLYRELGALHAGRLDVPAPEVKGVPRLALSVRVQSSRRPERMRRSANRTVELAGLATRLGRDAPARRLLDGLPDDEARWAAAPANLVLTRARLGDLDEAERLIAMLQSQPEGALISPDTERDLRQRLARARELLSQAQTGPPQAQAVARALAMASLGAYLRALRAIRPAYDNAPSSQEVAVPYVQMLVAARLEHEARAVVTRTADSAQAEKIVAQLRRALSPRLAAMDPPPEPSPWWPASPR